MAKTGRNEPCPCGSGKKFKHCCYGKPAPEAQSSGVPEELLVPTEGQQGPPTLRGEVEKVQRHALARQEALWTMGVFVFFSTAEGDGWLLDASAMDALQVAAGGQPIPVDIVQTADAIEITWSHTFVVDTHFTVTTYQDKLKTTYKSYPTVRISEVVGAVRQSLSPELLASLQVQ